MWISRQIIEAQRRGPAAVNACVTGTGAAGGYRSLPFAGPWGVTYLPPNAAQAVVVKTNAGSACVGTVMQECGIRPGELLLRSAGGAEIYLKNSGEVVINGQVFRAKEGG